MFKKGRAPHVFHVGDECRVLIEAFVAPVHMATAVRLRMKAKKDQKYNILKWSPQVYTIGTIERGTDLHRLPEMMDDTINNRRLWGLHQPRYSVISDAGVPVRNTNMPMPQPLLYFYPTELLFVPPNSVATTVAPPNMARINQFNKYNVIL